MKNIRTCPECGEPAEFEDFIWFPRSRKNNYDSPLYVCGTCSTEFVITKAKKNKRILSHGTYDILTKFQTTSYSEAFEDVEIINNSQI